MAKKKEYIEREALLRYFELLCAGDPNRFLWVETAIDKIPAADVVEVVRCEHCQYSHSLEDPFNNKTVYYCDVHQHQVRQDGFCSSGI